MDKPFTICGIDASLSSTGICFAECTFEESVREGLLDLLINLESSEDCTGIDSVFKIIHENEIKCPKELDEELIKVRKNQREAVKSGNQTSLRDTAMEEWLVIRKIENIVDNVVADIISYNPDVVIVEDYSYHSQGSTTQLAELKGALKSTLRHELFWRGCEPYFYTAPVPSVKKIASTNGLGNKQLICENMTRYGFTGYEDKDDQLDAIAVALSMFYAIYYRLYGFDFPEPTGKTSKEKTKMKNDIKSWVKCLETFANRIGSKDDLEKWVM